jgi:ABC-type transporter Mla subunit MlaD
MALQDLTPQLRTRLSRMERAVGWFVLLATALLVFGFSYYVYNTAQRKGWFKTRAPYFTFVDRATGLKVGDPVMLMGFEAGQITKVLPQPPEDFTYNVYVEFEIIEPNYGYLWTSGSRAKVESDFLGKRVLEVTKGTGGHATYLFHPLHELTLAEAERLEAPEKWLLGADIYDETETNLAIKALAPLQKETLAGLRQFRHEKFPAFDTREQRKSPTVVWNDKEGRYVKFVSKSNPKAKLQANLYWLPADESPAVSERLDKLIAQVEKALPNFLDLTNKITTMLANGVNLTSNLNAVALNAQPASSNLAYLTAQLRGPGALGEWALGTNGQRNLDSALENANTTIAHTDTNLTALVENLARSLDNLADITSNLNAQVQMNTNILGSISSAVVDADDLVQGLKRHWLLRSAFKEKKTNAPPESPRLRSPKDQGKP